MSSALLCDRLFTGGLLFLILTTPLAFGTVHPWAYSAMEVVIFALVIVWMAKLMVIRGQRSEVGGQLGEAGSMEHGRERLTPYALPLTLFVALSLPTHPASARSPARFVAANLRNLHADSSGLAGVCAVCGAGADSGCWVFGIRCWGNAERNER